MHARFGPSPVISKRPYNLEVDLLLKLVGREVCHMFSIHKYWIWLSSMQSLTLVGFHFGTNLYKMCPISPQSLSCTMCTCSASPAVMLLLSYTCGLMKSLLVSKLKRQLYVSVELEVSHSNKLLPGFKPHIWGLSLCTHGTVLRLQLAWNRGMQARCLAKLLLTVGERLIVGSAVSSQGFVCPLTPGMYVMTREGHTIHIQHDMCTWDHIWRAYCGTQKTVHEQDPGGQRTINYVSFSSSGQQNTSYPNPPLITSNIPPWIDLLHFCYTCYVLHIVLT